MTKKAKTISIDKKVTTPKAKKAEPAITDNGVFVVTTPIEETPLQLRKYIKY